MVASNDVMAAAIINERFVSLDNYAGGSSSVQQYKLILDICLIYWWRLNVGSKNFLPND